MNKNIVYLGVKAHVVAIDRESGRTLWSTKLKSGITSGDRFVTIIADSRQVFAHTCGELFCLDSSSGALLWTNNLEGLGYDIATLAIEGLSSQLPGAYRRQEKEAGAAGSVHSSSASD